MEIRFAFFGTDKFSTTILNELKLEGFLPAVVVTAPDRPAGRGQKMHEPDAKVWARENGVPVLQPEKLDGAFVDKIKKLGAEKGVETDGLGAVSGNKTGSADGWDLFLLASYGRIVPQSVLDIPKKGTLNVHPSMLPKYRGASPIESAILDDQRETGVTIMLMDSKMDHGPIVKQHAVNFMLWQEKSIIENELALIGGEMLTQIIPGWLDGTIVAEEQNHNEATFTKKISKEDGLIKFEDLENPDMQRDIFLKTIALSDWPGVYFFIKHGGEDLRVKITEASWSDEKVKIEKVIPAGRKEMLWRSFVDGFLNK